MNIDPIHPPADAPAIVFRSRGRKPCMERALVLQARGLPYQILSGPGEFSLVVPGVHVAAALGELDEYVEENVGWPPPKQPAPMLSSGKRGALAWIVVLTLIHPAGQRGFLGRDLWKEGMLMAGRVMDGEWWRAITALTLHGDAAHLVSNLVSGAAFLVLASHTLGGGLALLSTLLAGILGNLLNAWIQDPSHNAIGASTAVFGTLGLIVSYEWIRRHALGLSAMRRWAPLMAGGALLGYLGMGGGDPETVQFQRVDVMAHVTGFFAGGVLGFLWGKLELPDRLSTRGQVVATVMTAGLIVLGWTLAMT